MASAQEAAGRGRRFVVSAIVIGALLALVAAGIVLARDGGAWPGDAPAYLPDRIDGDVLVDDGPFGAALGRSFVAEEEELDVRTRTRGAPTADDPAPQQLLFAFGGAPDALDRLEARLEEDLFGDAPAAEARIRGVATQTGHLDQGDRRIAHATARPRDEVVLVVLDFGDDAEAAVETLEEMLTTARDR